MIVNGMTQFYESYHTTNKRPALDDSDELPIPVIRLINNVCNERAVRQLRGESYRTEVSRTTR